MTKAMLFAAGLGTRLKPFTDNHPKALAPINGITLLERNIRYLTSFGIREIVINIHHFGEQILDFLDKNRDFNCKILISDEQAEVLETGGGLCKAAPLLGKEPFLVMNVDILTDMDLNSFIHYHQERKPLVSLAVSDRNSSRKLFFDEGNRLTGWKNLTTGESIFVPPYSDDNSTPLAFSGIHIIDPELFSHIRQKGKFSIMKTYLKLMDKEKILGYKHSAYLIDVGKPESLKEAEKYFI
ncbi:MAG: nucleotidyltransferase family protein [Flavobacteriaceae bacterium]|jgi:NDP-sugar pyrophosphorylase family protein|nr:nucleotidyltransferase family protein [Flavobacteriaceae bacterium]